MTAGADGMLMTRRRDASRNLARFYAVGLQADLLDDWASSTFVSLADRTQNIEFVENFRVVAHRAGGSGPDRSARRPEAGAGGSGETGGRRLSRVR